MANNISSSYLIALLSIYIGKVLHPMGRGRWKKCITSPDIDSDRAIEADYMALGFAKK